MKEAFAAGWKAKQKVNAKRKARGFTDGKGVSSHTTTKKKSLRKKVSTIRVDPQKLRKSGDRNKGSGKGKGSGSSGGIDKRKENSHCNDCKGKGHWAGDDKCPMVMAGKRPPHARKGTHFTGMVEQVTTTKPVWLNFMVQNVPIPDTDGSEDQSQVARPADEFDLEQVHRFYRSQVPVGTIDSDSELSARTQQSARWYISEDSSPSEGTGPYSWERPVGEVIQAVRDMINSDEDDEDPEKSRG
jgi:hypothetical protein